MTDGGGGVRPRFFTCTWHDAQAAVLGAAWNNRIRLYRTEGRRQQGKGTARNGVSEGSLRQKLCT